MNTFSNDNLPQVRSFVSPEYIKPTEWINEIQNFEPDEIIKIIEIYEFVIASLIKAIEFLDFEQPLLEKVNSIYKKIHDYFNKHFNYKEKHKPLVEIIRFITFRKSFAMENRERDINAFCNSWNNYFIFFFGKSRRYYSKKILIEKSKTLENIDKFNEFVKYIKIPDINYNEIYNLLVLFDKLKDDFGKLKKERDIKNSLIDGLCLY